MKTEFKSVEQLMDERFYIGELAQAADVPVKTIRFYEEIGLLPAAQRADNGYRLYGAEDVQRLRFIRRIRSLDIPLEELHPVVALWDDNQIACSDMEQLLRQKLNEIERRIKMLQVLRSDLQLLLHQAEDCPAQTDSSIPCPKVYDF